MSQKYLCQKHNEIFVGYCLSCKVNVCSLCSVNHESHELMSFNIIKPDDKKVDEVKIKFIQYKEQNEKLIEKIEQWMKSILYYTNKIKDKLKEKKRQYEKLMNDYKSTNLIYENIKEMNTVIRKGFNLDYKSINFSLFENENNILEKSESIIYTIKEIYKEDLFLSIKQNNKKNNSQDNEKNKDIINENNKKEEIKYNKEAKGPEKENENEKINNKKILEVYNEINMSGKEFDNNFLIKMNEPTKIDNSKLSKSLNLFNSINNLSEINHINLIEFENIKYIVTVGYKYLNIFTLKGELDRNLELYENDITFFIQLKNGDLLTCSIDGNIKIIRILKNEGYKLIQSIDSHEINKKYDISGSTQLFTLLELRNGNIISPHNSSVFIFKDNKDFFEIKQVLSLEEKKKEDKEMYKYFYQLNNSIDIYCLVETNNNSFAGSDCSNILFFEEENQNYMMKEKIENLHCNGVPNIMLFNANLLFVGGNENIFIINVNDKKIIKDIKNDGFNISCLHLNNNNHLFAGCTYKNGQQNIIIYNVKYDELNKNNVSIEKFDEIKNLHDNNVTNIISLEDELLEENVSKIKLITGSHDKYIKLLK